MGDQTPIPRGWVQPRLHRGHLAVDPSWDKGFREVVEPRLGNEAFPWPAFREQ